jgi:hypothetical protein
MYSLQFILPVFTCEMSMQAFPAGNILNAAFLVTNTNKLYTHEK